MPDPKLRLFRHRPTGRWIPYAQNVTYATKATDYIPELAARYGLPEAEIEVVVTPDAKYPADWDEKVVPEPAPATPRRDDRAEARAALRLLEKDYETITDPVVQRLVQIVRVLVARSL